VIQKLDPGNERSVPPSRWVDIGGPVHYVDYGGPDDGPQLVLVHGLGGSLTSWAEVAPVLAQTARVIAFDLPGFGRTPGSPRQVTLVANRMLLYHFLIRITGMPVILVGHSMGGTIAAMLSAQHPALTAGLIFVDPAVPWQFENRVGSRLAGLVGDLREAAQAPGQPSRQSRVTLERALRRARESYERVAQSSSQAFERNLAAVRARIKDGQMNRDVLATVQSLTLTMSRRRQFALMLSRIKAPVLMLHGDRDKFVPISAARAAAQAHPDWRFEIAKGIGHWPMLEAPQWTTDHVVDWFGAEGAAAVESARKARPHP
jgi:pimeloyl-ACP methyl ester carboxylesterase